MAIVVVFCACLCMSLNDSDSNDRVSQVEATDPMEMQLAFKYDNFDPGQEYVIECVFKDYYSGEPLYCSGENFNKTITFIAEENGGTINLDFSGFDGSDLAGTVAYSDIWIKDASTGANVEHFGVNRGFIVEFV